VTDAIPRPAALSQSPVNKRIRAGCSARGRSGIRVMPSGNPRASSRVSRLAAARRPANAAGMLDTRVLEQTSSGLAKEN
jgi:hypothetical protein